MLLSLSGHILISNKLVHKTENKVTTISQYLYGEYSTRLYPASSLLTGSFQAYSSLTWEQGSKQAKGREKRRWSLVSSFMIHVSPLVIRPLAFITCDTLRVEINRKSNSNQSKTVQRLCSTPIPTNGPLIGR